MGIAYRWSRLTWWITAALENFNEGLRVKLLNDSAYRLWKKYRFDPRWECYMHDCTIRFSIPELEIILLKGDSDQYEFTIGKTVTCSFNGPLYWLYQGLAAKFVDRIRYLEKECIANAQRALDSSSDAGWPSMPQ